MTHFSILKRWGPDVGVEAIVVVDVPTVHPLHVLGTIFVQLIVLDCSVSFIIVLNYIPVLQQHYCFNFQYMHQNIHKDISSTDVYLTSGFSGKALLPQPLHSRLTYLWASSIRKDTTGSMEGFSTKGGSFGFTLAGGSTHCRAISKACALNHRRNTGG